MSSNQVNLPSRKLTVCYGKSQFSVGKSTIFMASFNSKLLVYQRVRSLHFFSIGDRLPDAAAQDAAKDQQRQKAGAVVTSQSRPVNAKTAGREDLGGSINGGTPSFHPIERDFPL